MALKLGIMGAARIVPQAILEPASKIADVSISGLASSDLVRGKHFAQSHGIEHVFADYDALLSDPNIDAVYIALSNDLHTFYIVEAAKAGKHILVEKPVCVTESEAIQIRKAVEDNGVLLHEAIMVRHHPWQERIREIIECNQYGKLVAMKSSFTYTLAQDRQSSYRFFPERGGGAFRDNAPYWIQFLQRCLGTSPEHIAASSDFDGPNGIDMDFTTTLGFPGGVNASFVASYRQAFEANHWIELEGGSLKIRNFFRPRIGYQKLIVKIETENHSDRILFPEENYYENQLNYFVQLVQGYKEPEPLENMQARVALTEKIYNTARQGKQIPV